MYVVFVNIHRFPQIFYDEGSIITYYSDFFKRECEVKEFIEKIKKDYPKSNLNEHNDNNEYHIKYVTLKLDNSINDFNIFCEMANLFPYHK